MNETLAYYEQNAQSFAQDTLHVDFTKTQQRFLEKLPEQGYILDLGCGSGRDTLAFLRAGYQVDAVDGSQTLCRLASEVTGICVRQMLFEELDAEGLYDGIWACSSILHLPKKELSSVLQKVARALKAGGIFYTSFKYGTFEGIRNGRYFTDFTKEDFVRFLACEPSLQILAYWQTSDVRPGRESEQWLNLLLEKGMA